MKEQPECKRSGCFKKAARGQVYCSRECAPCGNLSETDKDRRVSKAFEKKFDMKVENLSGRNGTTIIFDRYPMPPSENHLFENKVLPRSKKKNDNLSLFEDNKKESSVVYRVKSSGYREYIKRCEEYRMLQLIFVNSTRGVLKDYLRKGYMLQVDTIFQFPVDQIWTRRETVKAMDASNRIKACHDSLSHILDIDDRYFFRGFYEKAESCDDKEECVIVVIKAIKPRKTDEVRRLLRERRSVI